MGILIANNLYRNIKVIEDATHEDHEIIWIKINTSTRPTYIGAYYGPQEKIEKEIVNREYQEISTTILHLADDGEVLLAGDFNAKLQINTPKVKQDQSRNGDLLQTLIDSNNLQVPSIATENADWTRINRNKATERAVLDYIITTPALESRIQELKIDNEGHLTLKGKKQSDHNTITLTLQLRTHKTKKQITKRWAPGNKLAWEAYNEDMNKLSPRGKENYSEFEKTIIDSLTKNIGTITIRGSGRKKETQETREIRNRKKRAKKDLETAKQIQSPDIKAKTKAFKQAQNELKTHILKNLTDETTYKMNKLIEEGGNKSSNFWKTRKRLLKNEDDLEKYTQDEEGNEIKDPQAIKDHVANYYEQLFRAREPTKGYEESNKEIENKIEELRISTKNTKAEPFTLPELERAIKKLKRNKATGPDGIPNEALIEANRETKKAYLYMFNHITETKEIPPQWQKGELKRIYKGKGSKGKCSSERGITLSSNVGKLYERLINNRILREITITEEQAGGRKGMATTDHILRIKELIRKNKEQKKPTYITFLDVTKAYDKAWLDAIMYTMNKQGCTGAMWNLTDKLNQNLTAKIRTSLGHTRPIQITNSIRQGGVLAVTQYATLMDEINKQIEKQKSLNNKIQSTSTCLLWVDDVAIITNNLQDQKTLLQITTETANTYRIQFGKEKSKTMTIGTKSKTTPLHINNMEIDMCESYKYLGETITSKNTLDKHIQQIEGKVESALQTALYIAGDEHFRGIAMQTIWTLLETCIIPIITYGSETWTPTKAQTKKLNTILDNVIKRILMIPQSTPRECLYSELQIMDIEHTILLKRLNYTKTLSNKPNKAIETIMTDKGENSWISQTKKKMLELDLDYNIMKDQENRHAKRINKQTVTAHMEKNIDSTGITKSKYQFLKENKTTTQTDYLDKLTRRQGRAIFMARNRMLKTKANYKNMYNDTICRGCGQKPETQQHILEECPAIHTDPNIDLKTTKEDLFKIYSKQTKQMAKNIIQIQDTLRQW